MLVHVSVCQFVRLDNTCPCGSMCVLIRVDVCVLVRLDVCVSSQFVRLDC